MTMPYAYAVAEDGSHIRTLANGRTYATFREAEAALATMPPGAARDAATRKVNDAKQAACAAVWESTLMQGRHIADAVDAADMLTREQTTEARELTEQLRVGKVSADDAAARYAAILRAQRALEDRVKSWPGSIERAAATYADPIAEHDRLVAKFPQLVGRLNLHF